MATLELVFSLPNLEIGTNLYVDLRSAIPFSDMKTRHLAVIKCHNYKLLAWQERIVVRPGFYDNDLR